MIPVTKKYTAIRVPGTLNRPGKMAVAPRNAAAKGRPPRTKPACRRTRPPPPPAPSLAVRPHLAGRAAPADDRPIDRLNVSFVPLEHDARRNVRKKLQQRLLMRGLRLDETLLGDLDVEILRARKPHDGSKIDRLGLGRRVTRQRNGACDANAQGPTSNFQRPTAPTRAADGKRALP